MIAGTEAAPGSAAIPAVPLSAPDPDQAALRGVEIVISAPVGASLVLSNLSLVWTDRPAMQYGACWDYRGWWDRLDPVAQLSAHRQPDSLTIELTNLRVRLAYRWALEMENKTSGQPQGSGVDPQPLAGSRTGEELQRSEADQQLGSLPGSLPGVRGVGSLELAGILHFKLDLRPLPGVSECKGKFEAGGLQQHPASSLPPGLAAATMQPYLHSLASELARLVCYGHSTGSPATVLASTPRASIRVVNGASPNPAFVGLAGITNRFFSRNRLLFSMLGKGAASSTAPAASLGAESLPLREPASMRRDHGMALGGGAAAALLALVVVALRRRRDGGRRRVQGSFVQL